jgi:hypothetical protein
VNQRFGAVVERDVRLGGAGSAAAIEARSTRSGTILSAWDALADEGATRWTHPILANSALRSPPTHNSVARRLRYAGLIRRWLRPRGDRAIGDGSRGVPILQFPWWSR